MQIRRYEPWSLLDRFQKELNSLSRYDSLFGESSESDNSDIATSNWRPAVDIKEEENRFVIQADLPGVEPKDIEITMEQGILTIKGERTYENEEKHEGYRRIERAHGSFYRRFSLPDSANADSIEAQSKNGVLEVVIPKHEKKLPKKISVQG